MQHESFKSMIYLYRNFRGKTPGVTVLLSTKLNKKKSERGRRKCRKAVNMEKSWKK
jgi:hypothetical protein